LKEYLTIFSQARLAVDASEPSVLAARVSQSPIREQLLAALDEWAQQTLLYGDEKLQARLLQIARLADPDPVRDQLRDPALWNQPRTVRVLADRLLANRKALAQLSPQMLLMLGGMLSATGGDVASWRRHAFALYPGDFMLCFGNAIELRFNRPAESAAWFRAALAVRPRNVSAWHGLALALQQEGDLPGYTAAIRKALDIDPRYSLGWNELGAALHAQKDLKGAIAACRKALDIDPQLATAWNNLGRAHSDQGKFQDALAAYRQALALEPRDGRTWFNLALALSEHEDQGEVAALRRELERDPKLVEAYRSVGVYLGHQGDYRRAEAAYRRALDLNPQDALNWVHLGALLHSQQKLPLAVATFEKALAVDVCCKEAWLYIGAIRLAQKNHPAAEAAYQNALVIDPQDATAWYTLGVLAYQQKKLPEAEAALRKAVAGKPDFVDARLGLASTLAGQGQFAEAADCYQHVLKTLPPQDQRRAYCQTELRKVQPLLALEKRLPEVLQGRPTSSREQLQLAHFCQVHKKRYLDAVRLYTAALIAAPLEDGTECQDHRYRYQAACAAALAAAGQGHGANKLTAGDRAKLRQQALAWLRADLQFCRQLLAAGAGPNSSSPVKLTNRQVVPNKLTLIQEICQRLQHWQTNADLAGLREEQALAKLPPEERKAWRQLWADARLLLEQASAAAKQQPGSATPAQP
jgi:tetratricopeptide (TPR) repeat protein